MLIISHSLLCRDFIQLQLNTVTPITGKLRLILILASAKV